MYDRNIATAITRGLSDTPVVLLNGPRQAGKTTLAQQIIAHGYPARYVTLDDAIALAAARQDPAGFISGFEGPVVVDEVQRAPELLLAIKASVDRDRRPGRFLLTGSAKVLMVPRVADSLAGRMEILTLWPLSQGEIDGRRERFVDACFDPGWSLPTSSGEDREMTLRRALRGGYPEAVERTSPRRRATWYGAYLTAILQRDVRDLADIADLSAMPRLLALLAARSSSLVNHSELSRSLGIPLSTLKRYVGLLESTFLVHTIPAWAGSLGRRLVKSSKMSLIDTGLMARLSGLDSARFDSQPTLAGPLLETFVAAELRKQIGWSDTQPMLYHYRSAAGREVDIVLEDSSGRLVGIEVKARATVGSSDFDGLRELADLTGARFTRGVVLHNGRESVAFGERLWALPISDMWQGGTEAR